VIAIASGGDKAKSADAEDRWVASAGLMSLDDAIRSQCPDRYDDFAQATKGLNVSDALQAARSMDVAVVWDAEAARSREGWYRFAGSIKPAIDRAIACAKYADMLWTRTPATVIEDLTAFAQQVLAAVPGALLGYNLAPDVKGTGTSPLRIR
jgi:isocitrate lyase